jgi:hypothetical protein
MEKCGIFHLNTVDFVVIWYMLWSFSVFLWYFCGSCGTLRTFFRFGIFNQGKSGNPGCHRNTLLSMHVGNPKSLHLPTLPTHPDLF